MLLSSCFPCPTSSCFGTFCYHESHSLVQRIIAHSVWPQPAQAALSGHSSAFRRRSIAEWSPAASHSRSRGFKAEGRYIPRHETGAPRPACSRVLPVVQAERGYECQGKAEYIVSAFRALKRQTDRSRDATHFGGELLRSGGSVRRRHGLYHCRLCDPVLHHGGNGRRSVPHQRSSLVPPVWETPGESGRCR